MATFLGGINGTKESITPALNRKVTDLAFEIMNKSGKKSSQKLWNDSYNKAIKQFGYTPAYFKKVMSQLGSGNFEDIYDI